MLQKNVLHIETTAEQEQRYQTIYKECLAYLEELTKRNEALKKLNEELAKRK